MLTSYKTTIAGLAAICAALSTIGAIVTGSAPFTPETIGAAITGIVTGIGLICAKDNNVSNAPKPLAEAQSVVPN